MELHDSNNHYDAGADQPAGSDDVRPTVEATGASEGGEGGKAADGPRSPLSAFPPCNGPVGGDGDAAPPAPVAADILTPAPATNPVIDALRKTGHYRHPAATNEHRITCPFADEHAPGELNEAFYVEPSDAVPLGDFQCPCQHKKPHSIKALLDKLNVDRRAARCKPLITARVGELHRVVSAAEQVLLQRGGFYRSNSLIATIKVDARSGDVTTELVGDQALTLHLSAAADWEKYDGRGDEWRRCDVPSGVVSALMKSQAPGRLPVLNALARQPYLRNSEGTLITRPGYDAASGVYAMFDPAAFKLPLLTRENALKALHRLQGLLVEFEFENSIDCAATVSAMLTAAIRDYAQATTNRWHVIIGHMYRMAKRTSCPTRTRASPSRRSTIRGTTPASGPASPMCGCTTFGIARLQTW